jgi:hypothetical protein
MRNPCLCRLAGLLGQFKLHRATSLLLHNHGTISHATTRDDITDPQGNQVTAAQFAVDGQIKQVKVAWLPWIWSRIRIALITGKWICLCA